MEGDEERVVLGAEAYERGPQERPPREIEGAVCLLGGQAPERLFPLGERLLDRDAGEREGCRPHALPWLSLDRAPLEDRAQRLVALDDRRERPPERGDVERTADAKAARHVVGAARGLELLEEPDPFLVHRQRNGGVRVPWLVPWLAPWREGRAGRRRPFLP